MRGTAIGLLAGLFVSVGVGTAHASAIGPRSQVRADIVGGASAKQGALGFMAFIQRSTNAGSTDCSATVVSPSLVLTAAHCAINATTGAVNPPGSYVVVTGSADLMNANLIQVSGVSKVLTDPAYDAAKHDADAALLVLSTPTTAPSVALATSGLKQAGTAATIAGWGLTNSSATSAPEVLQVAGTVVQSSAYCAQYSPDFDALQICAMDYPDDLASICFGDSGGPLLVSYNHQFVEIGINAYVVSSACAPTLPQYFTDIEPQQSWIQKEIKAYAKASPVPSLSVTAVPSTSKATPSTRSAASAPPRITSGQAWSDSQRVLTRLYGTAFQRKAKLTHSCSRVSSSRLRCGVTFSSRASGHSTYYFGTVTVSSIKASGKAVSWSAKYAMHRVDAYCYLRSGHPSRCKVDTRRGSWAPA